MKTIIKSILSVFAIVLFTTANYAQTGIGTISPDGSAKLDITSNSNLVRKYDQNLEIQNINRLNKYIEIDGKNYEIYGLNNNKLVDYYISNDLNIDENINSYINKILTFTNLVECELYIFNNKHENKSDLECSSFRKMKRKKSISLCQPLKRLLIN